MSGLLDAITGKSAADAQRARESVQRKSLADLAASMAQVDQSAAPMGRRPTSRGRRLLTFLGGTGQQTLG